MHHGQSRGGTLLHPTNSLRKEQRQGHTVTIEKPALENLYLPLWHRYCIQSGASIPPEPKAMMHFPPVSDFPLFPKNFSDFVENLPNFTFSEKFFDFHPPKFLTTFFSH